MPSDVAHHDWTIDEREYRRHEARRGRRHAYEHIDPQRTAFVVIDLVPFFADGSPYVRGIVPRINTLASALRDAGGMVAWVVPGYREPTARDREFLGVDLAETYARSGGEGPIGDRLLPELETAGGDIMVEKTLHSAYFPGSSQLPELLAERGVDTLLLAGTVTNVCVDSTARDASNAGLRVILVADACAARRDQDHNAALQVIYRTFGDVRPTDEVLQLIGEVAEIDG